jgi:Arc/MetJ-type ribon-helix-helix transcriptional regulator
VGARGKAELLGLTERILHLYVKERLTVEQIAERLQEEEYDIGREAVRGALKKAKEQARRQEERIRAADVILESGRKSGGVDPIDAALQIAAGIGLDAILAMQNVEIEDFPKLVPLLLKIAEAQARITAARLSFQNGFESAKKAVLTSLKEELKGRPDLLEKLCGAVAALEPLKEKGK